MQKFYICYYIFQKTCRCVRNCDSQKNAGDTNRYLLNYSFEKIFIKSDLRSTVKLPEVKYCQNSCFGRNIHSRITFELIKINNRQWHHRVSLLEMLQKIYDLTSKGQGQNLTSGRGHVMTKIGNVAYQSTRLDETNTMKPSPTLHLFPIKSY